MRINLDFELLRTLVAFADSGSFKRAAQIVCRSQPAISMQMRRLEELVGHTLFAKRGREVVFTANGVNLASQARQLLTAHDRLVDQLHDVNVQGTVRLGIPDDYATILLPNIFGRIAADYPGVALDIIANTTPVLTELLGSGKLDLAILATPQPEADDLILRREPIVWVTSPDHEAHLRRPLTLALFSDDSPVYRATIASLMNFVDVQGEAIDFRIGLRSKSWAVLTTAAATGFAVATMARCVVPPQLRILQPADDFPDPGFIHIVMRATRDSQSLATSRLADEILDIFRQQMLGDGNATSAVGEAQAL